MSLLAIYVTLWRGIISHFLDHFARSELDLLVFLGLLYVFLRNINVSKYFLLGAVMHVIYNNLLLHRFASL